MRIGGYWMREQTRRQFCGLAAAGAAGLGLSRARGGERLPNIVYILADDLGYGDVQCLNPDRGKIPTPNIDRLAAEGMTFTDAHSGSAVCTPTRYGILTGRYAWRSRLQSGVLGPYAPPLIPPNASPFRRCCAAAVTPPRASASGTWAGIGPSENGQVAFDRSIARTVPPRVGFDSYFGTDVPNYPPYCFLRDDRSVGIPSVPKPKEMYGTDGLMLPGWRLDAILPELVREATGFIERSAAGGKPFFLYLPLTSPHTPLAVAAAWKGKSGLGLYGDWVMQTDAAVGEVLRALDRQGQRDRTLVIFTSDNGCAPYVGIDYDVEQPKQGRVSELEAKGHYPSGRWRGYKSDIWEGGHRIPFMARWPGVVRPGTRSGQVICLTDLMATCAAIVGASVPAGAGEDSVSILPALEGRSRRPLREATVHHSINGKFAIRQGRWKLALCSGSGGWTEPTDTRASAQGQPAVQLYDLAADPAERVNLQAKHPGTVKQLTALLKRYVEQGRSTAGPRQPNDVNVDIWKAAETGRRIGSD